MKNVVIIGHSSGIGAALSEHLSPHHYVFGTWYKHPPLRTDKNITSTCLNVLDDQPDYSFLPERVDALIYCPGAIHLKPFSRIKPDEFLMDYRLQVLGAITCIQTCLPNLKRSAHASVVLFSTVAVQTGFSFHSIVSSSKGAVEGLTKALAAELAPSIRVNCIAPGLTQTALASNLLNTPEKVEANAQRYPLKQIGQANDQAAMAAYLIDASSKWITGQIFHVDGGLSTLRI